MKEIMRKRVSLVITLVLYVFVILTITTTVIFWVGVLLYRTGLVRFEGLSFQGNRVRSPLPGAFMILSLCVVVGTALAAFLSRHMLNPIREIINATNRVADGDYDVRVNVKGVSELEELSKSFNKMTQALSSVETLRNDFISDFSHEFKTPIVSLMGYAKLLRSDEISEAERREYIEIIIAESNRLSTLATNVLNLTKFETLEIVDNKSLFRLDEQIRRAVLLLEPQWNEKELIFNLELDDVYYLGNEDITQQIWLNLIENAIKFSYKNGNIGIVLKEQQEEVILIIQDEGCGIDEESQAHVFEKFFQADSSRSGTGNGLGLTLVKRIVDLCGGSIDIESGYLKGTTVTVKLNSSQ